MLFFRKAAIPPKPRTPPKDWPELANEINYLILSSPGYIVYIDDEHDIEWKSRHEYDLEHSDFLHSQSYSMAKNKIDQIECLPMDGLEIRSKINFKRLIGEGFVRLLDGHFIQAQEIAEEAKAYLLQRKLELARSVVLKTVGFTSIVLTFVATFLWFFKDLAIERLSLNGFVILFSCLFGGIGAYLSVIQRIGNQQIDYNAPLYLLRIEGISRAIAGIISAIIVCLAIKLGIVFTIFSQGNHPMLGLIFGSLLAGYSERLAPSIVKNIENTNGVKMDEKLKSQDILPSK